MSNTEGNESQSARQRWMGALATAPSRRLAELWDDLQEVPEYELLRAPESGLIMTRGRVGGAGAPFNIGEMTVTRCSVRLKDGTVGHAYLAGRDRKKAQQAAVLDAMLQQPDKAGDLRRKIIEPLLAERADRDRCRAAKVAATKVDFFTMVRGED
ncbi:MAG: phosphonate C-P lyase system protein PhnG [Alphaproteobacteria bacterium]|nr:phosphonate C-P lyase system protein PhnG [Alphaproteobacteria bacterium]